MVQQTRWMPLRDALVASKQHGSKQVRRLPSHSRPYYDVTTYQAPAHPTSDPAIASELDATISSISEQLEHLKSLVSSLLDTPTTVTAVEPVAVTMEDAARMLGVSRATMFRLAASGVVERVQVGGTRRVSVAWVRNFANGRSS